MFNWLVKKVVGTQAQRTIKKMLPLAEEINRLEEELRSLSDEEVQAKTDEFRQRLEKGETTDDLLPEAFAVVKNTAWRFTEQKREVEVRGGLLTWEMVHYDVQLIGGIVLHRGNIAEMATGEGKTLVATLPVYLNALTGKGVHLVTVNEYLAQRDSEWMGEIYRWLGLTVGCILRDQSPDERREQYKCDVTYGTNSEFGFDYLRDNGMAQSREDQVQRGHHYAIIDEVDSILIDEARTPLIISGPATVSSHQYDKFKPLIERVVREQTRECNQWVSEAKELIDEGQMDEAGRLLYKTKMSMPRNKQLLKLLEVPENRRAMDDAELSLYQDPRRLELYKLKDEALFTLDEKTSEADLSDRGREFLNPNDPETFVLPDLLDGFHEIDTNAALSEQEKLKARQELQEKYDESSERIHNISQLLRAYCVFEADVNYVVQDGKVVIVDEFTGRPQPGRRWSDGLHQAIEAKEGVQIDRETQTLATITIQNYFRLYEKLAGMTGTAETEASEFADIYKLGVIPIPTNRPVARLDGNDAIYKTRRVKYNAIVDEIKEANGKGQPVLVGTVSVESSELISRMLKREGIGHKVLNAKFHQQESEVVAQAGQRGAVTIATNMAGRGTDIKLGDGVKDAGGLYVIGTERHESRRIDRQLRGRCARQGDTGMSRFFISFEDDLMRHFGDSRRISGMMTKLGMADDEELEHPWLNKSVETAQKRVEQRNYQRRKFTLQYDDVMNQHREAIYGFRNNILDTEDPRAELFDVVEGAISEEAATRLSGEENDPDAFLNWINGTFPIGAQAGDFGLSAPTAEEPPDEDATKPPAEVAEAVTAKVREAYELKVRDVDPEKVKYGERMTVLSAVDRLWQEHLYAMDGLRESIHLRALGQKDPLVEYKREAFEMYAEMESKITQEICNGMFRSAARIIEFEEFLKNMPQRLVHETPQSSFDEAGQAAAPAEAEAQQLPEVNLPVRRNAPKIGRNDPLPDGGGKKYKKVYQGDEPVFMPETYADWQQSITGICGLPLTPEFITQRLGELQNSQAKATKDFVKVYGEEHLGRVIGWFEKARDANGS
ncbi:MAG: preprotein translocase subunit SecA [Verrucomicrobiota bacterium]